MRNIVTAFLLLFLSTSPAQAHSVWINVFASNVHQPPHAMLSLGWGHALPVDDVLNSPNGRIQIKTFELITPGLKRTSLILPSAQESPAVRSGKNFDIFPGNLATQKVAFKKDSSLGVYQFALSSVSNFYTQYIDKKGRKRLVLKPKDELNDIDKVLMSFKYQAFAKSYLSLGKWKNPAGFGQSDGFELFSYLANGKAQFRVQSAGQWIISVNHKDDVSQDGPLKHLFGKAEQVYNGATLTFNVR